MEHINKHDHGQTVVHHNGHEVIDGGDERAGRHGGVDMDLMEQ